MKTNKKTFLAFAFAAIFMASLIGVGALSDKNGNIILGIWYDSNTATNTLTIQDGQNVSFNVYAFALGSTLDVKVDLLKSNGNILAPITHASRTYKKYNEYGLGDEGNFQIGKNEYIGIGTYKIKLVVTGIQKDSLELVLNVVAQPVPQNNAPKFISIPAVTVLEGATYTYDADACDNSDCSNPEGDTLTYSLVSVTPSSPVWTLPLVISSTTGMVTGTAPLVTTNTDYSVVVSVSDGTNSVNQVFDITVLDVAATDVNPPVVTITFPSNIVYDSGIGILNYTAIDAEGNLDQCWYSTNLGVTNSTAVACSGSFAINSVEGINRWTVYANDTFGNVGNAMLTFTVDTSTDEDDDSSSSNKKVTFVYEDPEKDKYDIQASGTSSVIDLTPGTVQQKGFFAKFIESIINFFRWLFS